jgi:hypothetical protein
MPALRPASRGALLLLLGSAGCANNYGSEMAALHFYASPPLPQARVDEKASELILRGPFVNQGSPCTNCMNVEELRPVVASAIEAFLEADPPTPGARQPARFRLIGDVETSNYLFCWAAPYFPWFTILGVPCGTSKASITLELQIGAQRWVARAAETMLNGLYYNCVDNIYAAPNNQAVLARATVAALKKIVRQASGAPEERKEGESK